MSGYQQMRRWVRAGAVLFTMTASLGLVFVGCNLDLKPYVDPNEGGVILRPDANGGTDASGTDTPEASPSDTGVPDASRPDVIIPPGGAKRVFVTSRVYQGNLGALAGADAKCKEVADTILPRGNFVAWLSLNTQGAPARINDVGPWFLVDGRTIIANNKAQLSSGAILNPIRLDERGQQVIENPLVWTGTKANGTPGDTCGNFNPAAAIGDGTAGRVDQKDDKWTEANQSINCNQALHLYCFEQ